MSSISWGKIRRATARIELSDGTTYEVELVDDPETPLAADLGWEREPVEVPWEKTGFLSWRVWEPGPVAIATVKLRGRAGKWTRNAAPEPRAED